MAKLASDITDATLLCEQCGYVLEGLDERGACPECGQKIAESLPSRRMGTPWQHERTLRSWWRTFAATVTYPVSTAATARIERTGMRRLTWLNVAIAGVLLSLCWSKDLWHSQIHFGMHNAGWWEVVWAAMTVMAVFLTPPVVVTIFLLTWIEMRGVRFFGNLRGWRVTPAVAWVVCGHMSYWWVVGAAVTLVFMMLFPHDVPDWDVVRRMRTLGIARDWEILVTLGCLVMFGAGLVPFECAVYLGVRRCKYANWLPRPQQQPEPHPSESPAHD